MFNAHLNQQNPADQLKLGPIEHTRSRLAPQLQAKRHAMQTLQRSERAMGTRARSKMRLPEARINIQRRQFCFMTADDALRTITAVLENYLGRLPAGCRCAAPARRRRGDVYH